MIKFSVSRLEKEPIELAGEEPAAWLELDDPVMKAVEPVCYDLLVKAVSSGALVEGKVRTVVAGDCGRCLQPVRLEVENSGICLYLTLPDEDEMDISDEIRAEMLLELPVNLICRDACAGLCPKCGADLNRTSCDCEPDDNPDSRWSALDGLEL